MINNEMNFVGMEVLSSLEVSVVSGALTREHGIILTTSSGVRGN